MLVLRKEDHSMDESERRSLAVGAYLAGAAPTEVARTVGRTVRWLLKWARRYREGRPEWAQDRSRAPHRMPGRSPTWVERLIVRVRRTLMTRPRVQHGAQAIRQVLAERGVTPLPRVGLINRVLTRHGLVSRRQRRFTPKGLPYPAIVPTGALCHALDPVGPRYLEGDGRFFSLHTMLVNSREVALEPHRHLTDPILLEALWKTWQRLGLPDYAQMDNKPPFTPSPRNPYRLSQVLRLLLTCGIEPIFIALAEPWRNGHVERFNSTYDQRFFRAQRFGSFAALVQASRGFERYHNHEWRYSTLGNRTPAEVGATLVRRYPPTGPLPLLEPGVPPGRIHVVRLVRSDQRVDLFGIRLRVRVAFMYRYLHATISTTEHCVRLYADGRLVKEQAWPVE